MRWPLLFLLYLYSTHYTALQTCKKLLQKVRVKSKQSHNVAPRINYTLIIEVCFALWLCSTRYTALETNNGVWKLFCSGSRSLQKMWKWEAVSCYRKLTPSIVSKNNTKEDKGKSMMHILHVLQLAKRQVLGRCDVEHCINQPCNSFHCWVTLGWMHQLVI